MQPNEDDDLPRRRRHGANPEGPGQDRLPYDVRGNPEGLEDGDRTFPAASGDRDHRVRDRVVGRERILRDPQATALDPGVRPAVVLVEDKTTLTDGGPLW